MLENGIKSVRVSEDTKTQNLNESNTWKHLFNNFIDETFLFSLTNQKNLLKFFVEFDANDKNFSLVGNNAISWVVLSRCMNRLLHC